MASSNLFMKRSWNLHCHHISVYSRSSQISYPQKRCTRGGRGCDDYNDVTKVNRVYKSMTDVRDMMQSHVGGKKHWLHNKEEPSTCAESIRSQDDLPQRCLNDSIQEVIIPLGSDGDVLQDDYLNFYGGVRVGKVLQDLDYLSVWCGFKYYKDSHQRPPFSLVTACVDNIDFNAPLDSQQDLKLKGFVSWVGTTSLETTISIEQQDENGDWKQKAESIFIMAARSLNDGRSAILNKMVPQTEEENWYYERGYQNKLRRKNLNTKSLFSSAPTAGEREIIHEKFLKTIKMERATFQSRTKPLNTVWMKDTRLKNLLICQPDKRNIYNKIFGGFLMRGAFELAWANACIHMKCNPHISSVKDIVFHRPVEIGSLLYLSSIVVYTGERHAQIRVVAEVYNAKTDSFEATNTFYFLFSAQSSIAQVMPKTYGEYILYLDGRRECGKQWRID